MPTEAAVAAILFLFWLSVRETAIYNRYEPFSVLGGLTFVFVAAAISYYGFKAMRWGKRRLLWRVRRRLLITYLFVGLTPIILLTTLGTLAWLGVSSEAMSRVLSAQVKRTEDEISTVAKSLADDYVSRGRMDEKTTRAWLEDRMKFLQKSYPGMRIDLWKGVQSKDEYKDLHEGTLMSAVSEANEETQPIGPYENSKVALIPEWLSHKHDWSGFAFIPPKEESQSPFGSPSFRASVSGVVDGAPFRLLVTEPVHREFISQLQSVTGINVRPFFLGAESAFIQRGNHSVTIGRREKSNGIKIGESNSQSGEMSEGAFRVDQLGKPFDRSMFPVFVKSTNWLNGEDSERLAFMFGWSWSEASKHLLEGGTLGDVIRKLLIVVGIIFLILELFALISAAWITRAITGTVHKLYRATEFINRGDFSHRVKVTSHDQLGELADAFNEMSSNIESLLEERVEKERLQREIEIAAEVQAQLFPSEVPALSTVELSAECRAARGVAGDYFDYVEIEPGLVAVALGDVSGKGISASLVMSNLQASLRAQSSMIAERLKAERAYSSVGAGEGASSGQLATIRAVCDVCPVNNIVNSINHQLCRSTEANRFATLFLGMYDDSVRTLSYTNAGHNPPMLVRREGAIQRLTVGGMMAGAFDWASYEEATVTLDRGDTLVIFSDGLTEAENGRGQEFGEDRLAKLIISNRHLGANELRDTVFEAVQKWSGEGERADDQTLVIIKAVDRIQ
jgi:sigma-B regulation protein RsbU (phosphoserine phosphatase)